MRVLITRPREDAAALARMLEERGHEPLIEPLLTIERVPARLDLAGVQAIVLTSANAASALDAVPAGVPILAVGERSAAAARNAGHEHVQVANGDAQSLAGLIVRRCRPADGALLHVCGTEVKEGLAEALADAGFELRRQPVYRARAARTLSSALQSALRARTIEAVLLFSPRTAGIFVDLVRAAGLDARLDRAMALCLSAAVAEPSRTLPWRAIRIAARPSRAALLDLLDGHGGRC